MRRRIEGHRFGALLGGHRRKRRMRDDVGVMRRTDGMTAAPVGSRGGFVDLYERTVADVYSYLASRLGDRGVVEELTQDVFVAGARRSRPVTWWTWPG